LRSRVPASVSASTPLTQSEGPGSASNDNDRKLPDARSEPLALHRGRHGDRSRRRNVSRCHRMTRPVVAPPGSVSHTPTIWPGAAASVVARSSHADRRRTAWSGPYARQPRLPGRGSRRRAEPETHDGSALTLRCIMQLTASMRRLPQRTKPIGPDLKRADRPGAAGASRGNRARLLALGEV
jgi:hypothetical protein